MLPRVIRSLVGWRRNPSFDRSLTSWFLCGELKPPTFTNSDRWTANIWNLPSHKSHDVLTDSTQGVATVPDPALVHNFSMTWANTEELWPSPRAGTNNPRVGYSLKIFQEANPPLGEGEKKAGSSPDHWGKINISPQCVGALVGTKLLECCAGGQMWSCSEHKEEARF